MPDKNGLIENLLFSALQNFHINTGALWQLMQTIRHTTDQVDRDRVRRYAHTLSRLLGEPADDLEHQLVSLLDSTFSQEIMPDYRETADFKQLMELNHDQTLIKKIGQWQKEHRLEAHRVVDMFAEIANYPPVSGVFLRRGAFILLMSFFEDFFKDLFYIHYLRSTGLTTPPSPEVEAKLREKAAKDYKKEWDERFETLKHYGVEDTTLHGYIPEISEFWERRNVLVHRNGRIDDKYLKQEKASPQAQLGQIILVSDAYLARAIDTVTALGWKMLLGCWRAWVSPRYSTNLHRFVSRVSYGLLRDQRYDLTAQICARYLHGQKKLNSYITQTICVNHGIACQRRGDAQSLEYVLGRLKRAKDWRIKIAYDILNGDSQSAYGKLVHAKIKGELAELDGQWPLFDPVRQEARFAVLLGYTPDQPSPV